MNSLEWIKTATAEEIVEQLIDRLEGCGLSMEGLEFSVQILQVFLERAQSEPTSPIGIAYELYSDDSTKELSSPHACVNFNILIKVGPDAGRWSGEVGRTMFKDRFREAMARNSAGINKGENG